MYKINKSTNSVSKLDVRLFKELQIKERENLQEWIATNPEMLGEDLLIIQKEFDGFNDTNERLDLLAIDKAGGLVIIENKLDDTGRNVVWQALKYTSYCSTLTTDQIIKMYQAYLSRYGKGEDAKESLLEFLEVDEENLLLNTTDQRMIFVANHYRKEVTSTVLWLLNHDVQIQCIKATPYSMGEDMFLQMEQIIPLPETKEYMIDAKEKEKEEKDKSKVVADSETKLIEYWSKLKVQLKNNKIDYLENVSAKPYFSIGFHRGPAIFAFCIGRYTNRVEIYFQNDADKAIIDAMAKYKEDINKGFEGYIIWERLADKKASRIKYEMPIHEFKMIEGRWGDKTNWDEVIDWFEVSMVKFYNQVYPIWVKVQKELRK